MNTIQQNILRVAKEIKRICEKFSLRYYLDYGTLLGAVRHQGFIPWDDDVDFCMPRPDYEKFIYICKTELGENFALRSMDEKNYIYHFIKIDDKSTTLIEDFNQSSGYKGGVYVDIFPLDALPNNKFKRRRYIRKCKYVKLRASLALVDFKGGGKHYPWYKRLIISLCKHSDGKKYLFKLDKLLKKYDYETAEYVSSYLFDNNIAPKDLFSEDAEYLFENEKFTSVKNYDDYLKILYGNYMQLPPIEQQVSNHFYRLDINKSYLDE